MIWFSSLGYHNNGSPYYNFVNEFGTCSSISGIMPIPGGNPKAGIEVYPNPSNNDLNVKISGDVTSEIKYEIVSVDGKVVKTGSTHQTSFGFNTGNFANGVYIISITDSQSTQGEQRFEVMH